MTGTLDVQTLNGRLRGTVAHLAEIAPADLFGVFSDEQRRLAATDSTRGRIAVGDVLPETMLRGADGRVSPVPDAGPVVLVFYRGPWCLYIAEQNNLSFPVLTDDVKAAQPAFGNDFTEINSGGEWSQPKPTVMVIDADRVVRFIDVRPDYTERTEPSAVLDAVRAFA